jgi:AcrR family transcriptional regulator
LESVNKIEVNVKERILIAAANLFSRGGYSGVSTREIASAARLNEVTIYRYFPHKRELYLAVLADELGRVHLRGDQLQDLAEAGDAREALSRAFAMIQTALFKRPLLLPLVLYGALEVAADVDVLLKRHVGEFVEVVTRYLDPWVAKDGVGGGKFLSRNTRGLVLALVSVAVFCPSLERVFPVTSASAAEALVETYVRAAEPERKAAGSAAGKSAVPAACSPLEVAG